MSSNALYCLLNPQLNGILMSVGDYKDGMMTVGVGEMGNDEVIVVEWSNEMEVNDNE